MNKTLLIILGIIAVGTILLFFTGKPAPEIPLNVTEEKVTLPGATYGDLVSINFVLYLENGTVVDTNNPEIAEKNKIMNYVKGPFTFVLGQSGKVQGFDEAILSVHEGEHKETWIEPSETEVVFEINKTKTINRFISINKLQAFPLSSYENFFKKPPIIGDVVKSEQFAFKYKIVNMTEKNVIAEIVAKEGEKYMLPNTEWQSKVAKIADKDIMFYQTPEENQTLQTPFGPATINFTKSVMYIHFQPELNSIFNKSIELGGGFSIPQAFQIVKIGGDTFTIKRYGVLTEKRLKLVADILSIIKGVKEVKQDKPVVTEVIGGTEN